MDIGRDIESSNIIETNDEDRFRRFKTRVCCIYTLVILGILGFGYIYIRNKYDD